MKLSLRQKFETLIFNTGHPNNLRRKFRGMWDAAPSKADAVLAFVVFLLRIAARKNVEGEWGMRQTEKPLREVFKDKLVG